MTLLYIYKRINGIVVWFSAPAFNDAEQALGHVQKSELEQNAALIAKVMG